MPRFLAVPAALAVFLTAAGCSGDDGPPVGAWSASSGRPSASAAPSSPVKLSAQARAVCQQARQAGITFGKNFLADLQSRFEAADKGAAARSKAQAKIDRDVEEYSQALADLAKLTTDSALKQALKQMSKQVIAFKGDIAEINQDETSAITATLDKACGRG